MARPKGGGGDAGDKLLRAAGRGFRAGGFGGIGVDGLAKEAGLTSGAFYAYFSSKADAFRSAVTDGLALLRSGVEAHQTRYGSGWLPSFVDFYLGERMEVELCEACALPTFTSDVTRSNEDTRTAYTAEVEEIVTLIAEGLTGEKRRERAWKLLAILAGAAGMARAVNDPAARAEILAAAGTSAKAV
jgi:AcrR family transcriptional regulator